MSEQRENLSGGKGQNKSRCKSYGEQDFVRYLRRAMTGQEAERVGVHLKECDECLRMLYRCHVEIEKQRDDEIVRRSIALHNGLVKAKAENLLEILVKFSGRLLQLVSTTGELLMVPTLAPARGEPAAEERVEPLRVVQEFETPPVSVQASLDRCGEEGGFNLRISVYGRKEEEFLSGIEVEVAGGENPGVMMTDEDGEVSFLVKEEGNYRVTLSSGAAQIGEISLTVEMD